MSITDLIRNKSAASLPADQPQLVTSTDLDRLQNSRSSVSVGDGESLPSNVVDRITRRRASTDSGDRSQERRASLDISSFGKGLGGAGSLARP